MQHFIYFLQSFLVLPSYTVYAPKCGHLLDSSNERLIKAQHATRMRREILTSNSDGWNLDLESLPYQMLRRLCGTQSVSTR